MYSVLRWLVRTPNGNEGWVPAGCLKSKRRQDRTGAVEIEEVSDHSYRSRENPRAEREAIVKELIETEEEFGADLKKVVADYEKVFHSETVTSAIPKLKQDAFSLFQQISKFHNE